MTLEDFRAVYQEKEKRWRERYNVPEDFESLFELAENYDPLAGHITYTEVVDSMEEDRVKAEMNLVTARFLTFSNIASEIDTRARGIDPATDRVVGTVGELLEIAATQGGRLAQLARRKLELEDSDHDPKD